MSGPDPSVWEQPAVQAWLQEHATADPTAVALKESPFEGSPTAAQLARQLAGWQKARTKLPHYYHTPGLAYPPSLSMEQCSSEETARWKSQYLTGRTLADLTGGFGVDAFFLGERFEELYVVESQPDLARLARHNLSVLRQKPFSVYTGTAEDLLPQLPSTPDWLYLDPARRDDSGGRVFRLEDCQPNVVEFLPHLRAYTPHIMLKAAPLLDIEQALTDLGGAREVVVLAVRNEVKELLFVLGPQNSPDPPVRAVNLTPQGEVSFAFRRSEEAQTSSNVGAVQAYLFEPNAAVLKAGAFKQVGQRFGLTKLHPNTHLYTHTEDVAAFPGRRWRVLDSCAPQKKALRKRLPADQAMVGIRNFPQGAPQLQKKLGLKDGGSHYVMGYTNHQEQKMLAVLEPLA